MFQWTLELCFTSKWESLFFQIIYKWRISYHKFRRINPINPNAFRVHVQRVALIAMTLGLPAETSGIFINFYSTQKNETKTEKNLKSKYSKLKSNITYNLDNRNEGLGLKFG